MACCGVWIQYYIMGKSLFQHRDSFFMFNNSHTIDGELNVKLTVVQRCRGRGGNVLRVYTSLLRAFA